MKHTIIRVYLNMTPASCYALKQESGQAGSAFPSYFYEFLISSGHKAPSSKAEWNMKSIFQAVPAQAPSMSGSIFRRRCNIGKLRENT
ncbi:MULTISPECIES: hypothetical protein [Burkholderia]|uniref:hypothetical protein n=1 Tax=Burkholderia TaxID=32008 RepID=UPI0012E34900|nr:MULTISPECIES: hypothetical protein [Burkholderia]